MTVVLCVVGTWQNILMYVDVDCDGRSSRQDWEIVVKRGRIDDWKWTSNNSAK